MLPVLVLRPEPGNAITCTAARAQGLDAHGAPLFVYQPRDWALPADARWDGLLIGSAAVFAHGGPQLAGLRTLPVHAVGAATARAAINAGFTVAATGSGGLQPLVAQLGAGRYLRLAGEAHVALAAPPGVLIDDVVVYVAQPQPLDPRAITLIARGPALVLLHSAEAARHFGQVCDRHSFDRRAIALACLAPRIAKAAGSGWQSVEIAKSPDDDAMLSLARQMCQRV